jgi:hypothetical protein
MTDLQPQFRTGKWTFLLDGRVVETFYEGSSEASRFHVDYFTVQGKEDGQDLKVKWGNDVSGMVVNGGKTKIPANEVPMFQAFIDQARANRTPA